VNEKPWTRGRLLAARLRNDSGGALGELADSSC
jgi:hypothetical protein